MGMDFAIFTGFIVKLESSLLVNERGVIVAGICGLIAAIRGGGDIVAELPLLDKLDT
jgi:hypothetical protein